MKNINTLITLLLLLGSAGYLMAQNSSQDCKVLSGKISGTYTGECKNGLAHGKGHSIGVDEYEGKFKKGLPDGPGKYTWSNGNVYEGQWKNGVKHGAGVLFNSTTNKATNGIWASDTIKKVIVKEYKVLLASSISFVNIKRTPAIQTGRVQVEFDIPSSHKFFSSLEIEHSSGLLVKSNGKCLFDDVTFPFKAEISFVISGQSFVIHKRCIAQFEIYEESGWTVVIKE